MTHLLQVLQAQVRVQQNIMVKMTQLSVRPSPEHPSAVAIFRHA